MGVRDGSLSVPQGMTMAANFKCMNDNILCEVAATRLALATEGKAHSFGKVVRMGRLAISAVADEDEPPLIAA